MSDVGLILANKINRLAIVLATLLVSSCASLAPPSTRDAELLETEQARINLLDSQQDPLADAAYDLMVAEVALNRGETEIAVEYYLKLAQSQSNPEIAERAVRVAVFGQNLDAAIEAAQRWIELDPDRVEAQQVIAAIYIRQSKVDEAFAYIDSLIQSSELEDRQLFAPLLGILARENNVGTVLSISMRIAEKYPQRAHAQYLHGMLAAQHGHSEIALEYLDRTLILENIDGAQTARAKVLVKLGQPQEAVSSLQLVVENNPDDMVLRMVYARLLVDVKEYEKARVQFEILHKAAPDDAELLYTLGLLSLDSNRLDDAENYLLQLLRLNQREGETQYYLGRIYEKREQYDVAIEWYQKVHVGDYAFDARLRIADLLGTSGQFDEAILQLDNMLKGSLSDSSVVRIYIARGGILRSAGRYDEAMETYNTALDIVPGNSDLLYARALAAEKVGRIDILEADIKVILENEPDNAHALNALGFTLADQTDRYSEALGYLQRAIEIMPDDAAIIDSLGWVNYRMGNYEEAILLLRKALARFDDSEIAAHLGEVLWVSGRQEEAHQVWQEGLKKSPGDPLLQKVMQRFIP